MRFFSQVTLGVSTVLVALPIFTSATPVEIDVIGRQAASQCTGGSIQCCNSVSTTSSSSTNTLAGLLGAVLDLRGLVGLHCSPITAIGLAGTTCTSQTVCCNGNTYQGGMLVLGCVPINIAV